MHTLLAEDDFDMDGALQKGIIQNIYFGTYKV
jgi:hypothetical protein